MPSEKPQSFELPNGLRVVLEENHNAPVVSLQVMVQVGSADETDSQAGLSHVIEHMLFKGTNKRPVGAIARDVEAAGGEINAYTSFDQTVYYINMAKRFVDEGLDILSDSVQNPLFNAQELEREKEVILEEIRRERDQPARWIGEILFQNAFKEHPYGRPIIGFEKTVRSFTEQDLFQFFHKWYIPKNTTFIAVGDFETSSFLKKVEAAFGGMKISEPLKHERKREPIQTDLRFIATPDNIQDTYFTLGFHATHMTHEETPALDLFSHILGGTTSSRLEQIVKEKKQLTHSISSYAYTMKDPGLFLIGGETKSSKMGDCLQALWEEIAKLQEKGPTSEELKRAKVNLRAQEVYEKETVGGEAGKIAYFLATTGRLDFEDDYYQHLEKVTLEEIQKVAKKYLTPSNTTAAFMVPKKECNPQWEGKMKERLKNPLLPKTEAKPRLKKFEKSETRRMVLPNGLRVVLRENHAFPLVSICAASFGGLLAETPKNNGIHQLLSQCFTKGTKKRSALEIAEAAEQMAGRVDGFSGKNSCGLHTEFLSEFLDEGLDLFAEILMSPAWDPKEVEKEKKLTLQAIKNMEDNLSQLAFHYFQKNLYPKHPYGMHLIGSRQSIPKITHKHLGEWHKKLMTTQNMVFSIVGDFETDDLIQKMNKKIQLPKNKFVFKHPKWDLRPSKIRVTKQKKGKAQTHIVLGFMGATIKSPDYPKMVVLNNILSGMGGRLFLNLRDKMSLAYAVTSVLQEGIDPGFFAVYIGTEPRKTDLAIEAIKKELKEIQSKKVSREELEKSQNHLVGTYEVELQRNSTLANAYALNELYGLGFEEVLKYPKKIMKVTREDILEVAQKYIDLNAYTLSIVA